MQVKDLFFRLEHTQYFTCQIKRTGNNHRFLRYRIKCQFMQIFFQILDRLTIAYAKRKCLAANL